MFVQLVNCFSLDVEPGGRWFELQRETDTISLVNLINIYKLHLTIILGQTLYVIIFIQKIEIVCW